MLASADIIKAIVLLPLSVSVTAAPSTVHIPVSSDALPSLNTALPYEALGSIDVGTGESSIFMFNNKHYLLDNLFCNYIDHYGKWNTSFAGHSYARIREFDTGVVIANVSQTIATSFVSAFVDHRPDGDVLWLSALNEDRCKQQCGTGVLAINSTDLVTYTSALAGGIGNTLRTCNTEVAKVYTPPPPGGLPPHRYVMILEPFTFYVNNNANGDLSQGWMPATGSKAPHAPGGGPSIRYEGGYYYVITGGHTVQLCRSKDLGMSDAWKCTLMVAPSWEGGAPGPGDAAIAPYVGFANDADRKDFPVMMHNITAWDWNSNDADVCCTGGSSPSFLVWGASTQGSKSKLPPGSPSCTNAVGRANVTLETLLDSFFA